MIIATAGHVDHGKTSLVRTLTGVDTDRLTEEKKRGLSIDLGFAYWPLPSGSVLGFVDVPGHERFVGNMLAGMAGIDAALLVVAADDGPMPQTHQHLAILDLIGVSRGLIALTKCDLVTPERIDIVARMIRDCLSTTTLSGASIIAVSAVTGDGLEKLRAEIMALDMSLRPKKSEGHFRMTIDRAFQIRGSGLIVTGTITAGLVAPGDRLKLTPTGQAVRVRTIHAQNALSDEGITGQRVGLNITGSGINYKHAGRGNWLVADPLHSPTKNLDIRIYLLASEEKALKRWTKVHLHIGAAQLTARIGLLDRKILEPGISGYAQLNLDHPVSALYGDRFILRDAAATRTIGGGYVIDPFAIARGRSHPKRVARLNALNHPEVKKALKAFLDVSDQGINLTSFFLTRNILENDAQHKFSDIAMHCITTKFGHIAFAQDSWRSLAQHVLKMLEKSSVSNPIEPGLNLTDLRHSTTKGFFPETISALVEDLLKAGRVTFDGQYVRLPRHIRSLSVEDVELTNRVLEALKKKPSTPPPTGPLASMLSIKPPNLLRILRRMESEGTIISVVANRYYLRNTIITFASVAVSAGIDSDGKLQLAKFRSVTDLNRNQAIEVLEYFDRIGFTKRTGNARILLKQVSDVFPPTSQETISRHDMH